MKNVRGRRQDNGRYGKIFGDILTKDFLLEEYCNKKRSPYKIADEAGCSVKLIYNYLESFGIVREYKLSVAKNEEFGLLTALEIIGKSKNGTYIWKCKCSCGNFTEVPSTRLKAGKCKSCGCYRKRKRNHRWNGYCDISGTRMAAIRNSAKNRNKVFDLDAKFLWELFIKQNGKCAISGLDISLDKNASVDRINSKLGYTEDNVWWVHQDINKMKLDFVLLDFIKYCEIITTFQKGDKNEMATTPCS